jgi:phosphoribosylanthranilate isomerase
MEIIQAAGIKSIEEARMLIDCGFTHLGFPHFLPVNREDTTLSESKEIIKEVCNKASCVLITYQYKAKEIIETMKYLSVDFLQLHGKIELEEIKNIRNNNKDIRIIKSLIIRDDNKIFPIDEINEYEDQVDYFITDTYDPKTGAEGATGKTHDWNMSREIVIYSKKPVILAGGLTPDNISDAIRVVKPFGVDVHTGIEDDIGNKDRDKACLFVFNI